MTAPRMTPERIEEIRARLEAATPGPWLACTSDRKRNAAGDDGGVFAALSGTPERRIATAWDHPQIKGPLPIVTMGYGPYHEPTQFVHIEAADAALIANAPADLTALLRELDLMRADATATMEAAARGEGRAALSDAARGEDAMDHIGDMAVLYRRAQSAERERDLLAETARRLTGERDAARAQVEGWRNLVSPFLGWAQSPGVLSTRWLGRSVFDGVRAELEEARAANARMEDAIRWVSGEIGNWPGERPEGRGPYFWRAEMMERAGLRFLCEIEREATDA